MPPPPSLNWFREGLVTEESNYCVYKHTSPSGKVYIGITRQSVENRWKNGLGYESSPHFWNAIQKYGWNSFSHEILISGISKDDACAEERRLISELNAMNPSFGYNQKTGGEIGVSLSQEVRKKLSENKKRFYLEHPEAKEELSMRMRGYHHTEETRAKISASKKGITFVETPEWRQHIGEANKRKMQLDRELYEKTANRLRELGKQNSIPVVQVGLDGNDIARYESATEAQRNTGAKNCNIIMCCQGKRKTANGYKWRFANDYSCARESAQ